MSLNIDELDALLEAPYKQRQNVTARERKSSKDRVKEGPHSPARRKSRYPDDDNYRPSHSSSLSSRRTSRDNSREKYSHSKQDRHSKSPSRSRSPSRPRSTFLRRKKSISPSPELSEADRDRRTIFVQQLAVRLRESELRDFFSKVGKVCQVKIVTDRITGRSKGFGYVEFRDEPSVPLAILLSGQKLLGIPILVSYTESEKNRLAEEAAAMSTSRSSSESARATLPPQSSANIQSKMDKNVKKPPSSFKRLFVSSIYPDVDEHMLTPIFDAYGRIEHLSLLVDPLSKRSKGAAIVSYYESSAARRALEQLDGVEIAGKKIKITPASDGQMKALTDDSEATIAFSMTSQSRAELMVRLARESDVLPSSISKENSSSYFVLLSNVYDPALEAATSSMWQSDLTDDIYEEGTKFGPLVEKPIVLGNIQGEVILQYSDMASSQLALAALQGRWFGGRQIRASIISSQTYNSKISNLKSKRY